MKSGFGMALALVVAGLATFGSTAHSTGAPTIEVHFTGMASPRGTVLLALYNDQAGYDAMRAFRQAMAPINGGEAVASFAGLRPGRYAIQAFHDLNGNGRLDKNLLGIPREPYAFSNNAQGRMGPATWASASFVVGEGAVVQRIVIR